MRTPHPDDGPLLTPPRDDRLGATAASVIAALTEGVVVLDADGVVLAVNPAGEQILGAPAALMLGARLLDLPWTAFDMQGARVQRDQHPVILALRTGEPQPERLLRYPRPDRVALWIATSARPLFNEDGSSHGAVSSFRDVTRRVEAEESTARLAAILDATPDVVGMFDPSGRLFYTNQAGRRAMGLPDSKDVEIPADAIQRGHSSGDAARVLVEATAVARREGLWRGETTLINADGTHHVMSQTVIAHRDHAGEVTHFSSILHDVSEMRKTEYLLREQAEELELQSEELAQQAEELLDARDAAEAANRTKSRFLAQMSHELRTPLTAIIGFSRVLEANRDARLSEKEVLYASRVSTNARRLLGLINDLLDISKVESGHTEIEWAEVDVAALAADVVADLETRERPAGVALLLQLPGGARPLRADEQKLRQVILNLVGNALKFTAAGSVTVVLQLEANGTPLALDVEDTGIGIDPANFAAVFEPFAQEDASITRRFGGTGLGLAISKQFCEMMGFTLELTSTPGTGSRFRVRFAR